MNARFRLIAILSVTLLLKVGLVAQSVPTLINYQGQIQNPNGTTPPTADYELTLNIYDAPSGGTLIWGPQRFNGQSGPGLAAKVPVVQGHFNVTIGPQDTTARSLAGAFGGSVRYVELRVGTNPPIVPRQQLLSAPFALRAGTAGNSDNASKLAGQDWGAFFSNGDPLTGKISGTRVEVSTISDAQLSPGIAVPVGAVIMWWGALAQLPSGFELCDGNYPTNLGALLQINKPDLRDRFVKGGNMEATDVAGVRVLGGTNTISYRLSGDTSLTQTQIPSHFHPVNITSETSGEHRHSLIMQGNPGGTYGLVPGGVGGVDGLHARTTTDSGNHNHSVIGNTGSTGGGMPHNHTIPGHDNRPAFLEMFFIIRVK